MNASDFRQAHRTAWLADHLNRSGYVTFVVYHRMFHCTERTFYRDLSLLAEVGIATEAHHDHGRIDLVSKGSTR